MIWFINPDRLCAASRFVFDGLQSAEPTPRSPALIRFIDIHTSLITGSKVTAAFIDDGFYLWIIIISNAGKAATLNPNDPETGNIH